MHAHDTNTTFGEQVTVGGSVVGLAVATRLHAFGALLQVVAGGPIRWYADTRTPTATTGFVCVEGGSIELQSAYELQTFKAIKDTTGTDATLEIMARK